MRTDIKGDLVVLRPLRAKDMRKRAEWTSDAELVALMGADPDEEPFESLDVEEQGNIGWLEERQIDGDHLYAIQVRGRYIGDIDVVFLPEAHKAELTVFIGERTAWGKGYGSESVRLVLNELRTSSEVSHVEVDAPHGNDRALAFWRKLGFELIRADPQGLRWLRLQFEQEGADAK